jgi:integrase
MKVFKQQIVTYRTREGKKCKSTDAGAVKTTRESYQWYGEFVDACGRRRRVPLCPDKREAEKMLAKLITDAKMATLGMVDRYAEHRDRPILEHLEDFRRDLEAGASVPEHVKKTVSQVRAIVKGCEFRVIDDVDEASVKRFLDALRRARPIPQLDQEHYTTKEFAALAGIAPRSLNRLERRGSIQTCGRAPGSGLRKLYHREEVRRWLEKQNRGVGRVTRNHYLTSLKSFFAFLLRNRRTNYNPVAFAELLNPKEDRRHRRRALTEEQFSRFVDATIGGKPFRQLTGQDRLLIYTLAANTGFRASELASLTPSSFNFGVKPPIVTVEAAYSKHRREDEQPLRADVAELMKQYIVGKALNQPLWPGSWTEAAAEMVRHDLEAAGIPYKDEKERVFDFHSLRGQFITSLAAGGVHPKVAQVLARLSTITLTMDFYTHVDVLDVAGALDKLPGLPKRGAYARKDESQGKSEVA